MSEYLCVKGHHTEGMLETPVAFGATKLSAPFNRHCSRFLAKRLVLP